MPSPYSPPWARGPAGRRRGGTENPQQRVSDAERADVADRLSKHYGDGRLDQAEFNERLERAMLAKTQADLTGLLDDLPAGQPAAEAVPQRPRRPYHRILFLVLLVVIAAAAGNALLHPFFFFAPIPWLLIGVVAFLLLRRGGPWRYRGGQGPH
jgi:hypothetical protein